MTSAGGADSVNKEKRMVTSSFKNPFSKKHWNMTEQGRICRSRPEIIDQLKAEAAEEETKRQKRIEWLKDQIQYLQKELDTLVSEK